MIFETTSKGLAVAAYIILASPTGGAGLFTDSLAMDSETEIEQQARQVQVQDIAGSDR